MNSRVVFLCVIRYKWSDTVVRLCHASSIRPQTTEAFCLVNASQISSYPLHRLCNGWTCTNMTLKFSGISDALKQGFPVGRSLSTVNH